MLITASSCIDIAGYRWAIVHQLQTHVGAGLVMRTYAEFDLADQAARHAFFPVKRIYESLMMECNVIHEAHQWFCARTNEMRR